MQDFFIDVYNNEEKYQYLLKEYDSEEHGYNYHVKKFKINYEYFNKKWDYLKSSFFDQGIKYIYKQIILILVIQKNFYWLKIINLEINEC